MLACAAGSNEGGCVAARMYTDAGNQACQQAICCPSQLTNTVAQTSEISNKS